MDDLIAFLTARYDEEAATAARPGGTGESLRPWEIAGDPYLRIARARVVTEVMSKRQLLEASAVACPPACGRGGEHAFSGACALRWMGPVTEADGGRWVHDDTGARFTAPPVTPEWTIRVLALPYAGHPDYRTEWRP
ncbi:hypothetical protein J3A78_001103 [Streptomyces sp. PvR006]|uniref:DUF6221 family protein n=1 Tax=unclassified Streptomyces TaxID=2593676 RepID=UPI001AEAFB9B|nr:DUF6221 family protein [Streptomyces sp. PvR006]MBP2580625.1 hypothetical protein [Streptomyces sp. PvR006]